jgi:hypothetical protein
MLNLTLLIVFNVIPDTIAVGRGAEAFSFGEGWERVYRTLRQFPPLNDIKLILWN